MNDDQKEALSKLGEFIDFIYLELSKVQGTHFYKRKKNVFLPMFVNACDLASSVLILLEKERTNSAQNLIRSMQETWINTRFIFIDGSYVWVDSYLLESEVDMSKFARGARALRLRYPKADTNKNTFDEKQLKRLEARADKFTQYVKTKHTTLTPVPDVAVRDLYKKPYSLRDKTKVIDHVLAKRIHPKDLTYSDEWQYLMVYKYLSGGAHIGAKYLASNLVRKDRTGTTMLKHGDLRSTQLCAWSAYAFLYDLSVVFSKQFGYPKASELRPYRRAMKELAKKIL